MIDGVLRGAKDRVLAPVVARLVGRVSPRWLTLLSLACGVGGVRRGAARHRRGAGRHGGLGHGHAAWPTVAPQLFGLMAVLVAVTIVQRLRWATGNLA